MVEAAAVESTRPPISLEADGFPKPRPRVGIRVDMTPMVDVAFLLLIFFMVTTVFRQPTAMEINLPAPDATVSVPESNVLTVFVDREDALFARIAAEPPSRVTWDDLRPTFEANVTANPDLIVLVRIHPRAPFETMVDMMDLLEDAGMTRFSLVRMNEEDTALMETLK